MWGFNKTVTDLFWHKLFFFEASILWGRGSSLENIKSAIFQFPHLSFTAVPLRVVIFDYLESSPRYSPDFASGIAVCISPLLVHVKEKILPQSAPKWTRIHSSVRPDGLKISATTWTAGWYHFIYSSRFWMRYVCRTFQVYHIHPYKPWKCL